MGPEIPKPALFPGMLMRSKVLIGQGLMYSYEISSPGALNDTRVSGLRSLGWAAATLPLAVVHRGSDMVGRSTAGPRSWKGKPMDTQVNRWVQGGRRKPCWEILACFQAEGTEQSSGWQSQRSVLWRGRVASHCCRIMRHWQTTKDLFLRFLFPN